MRKVCLLLLVIVATGCIAQSRIMVSGNIINEEGAAVEYATIGIPSKGVGTLSDGNGAFNLVVESESNDTLLISHVSYREIRIPVNEFLTIADNVVMKTKVLDEVVVYNGKRKNAKLSSRGVKIPGMFTVWTLESKGYEVGSIIKVERVFELLETSFKVRSNSIAGAKFSVNIYKEDETTGTFCNTLCKPIYFNVPVSAEEQEIKVEMNDNVVIHPGKYFVSIKFLDDDMAGIASAEMPTASIYIPLYLKKSYIRNGVMDELESVPMSLGLSFKGIEYR